MPRLPSNSDPFRRSNSNRLNLMYDQVSDKLQALYVETYKWYNEQSTTRKVIVCILALLAAAVAVLVIIFHSYIIKLLVYLSDVWLELEYGRVLLFTLVFFVGFPPLLGFSPLSMLSGMVYGFPGGWPILASASITGLFCSFLVFRYLLHRQAVHLIHSNEKFRAFSDILKEDSSLILLILIRLCPLPYSLSNGALAAIPELPAWRYLLASIITSPKLFIHIFVGLKLKQLGDEKSTLATKIVDVISIIITGCASALTTYIIYNRMQTKLDTYHQTNNTVTGDYDSMIFGNFEDDAGSSVTNVELDSNDFDADNFVIDDEDDELEVENHSEETPLPPYGQNSQTNKTNGFREDEV